MFSQVKCHLSRPSVTVIHRKCPMLWARSGHEPTAVFSLRRWSSHSGAGGSDQSIPGERTRRWGPSWTRTAHALNRGTPLVVHLLQLSDPGRIGGAAPPCLPTYPGSERPRSSDRGLLTCRHRPPPRVDLDVDDLPERLRRPPGHQGPAMCCAQGGIAAVGVAPVITVPHRTSLPRFTTVPP